MYFKDLTWKRFHLLTLIKRVDNKWKNIMWECKCDCWNIKNISWRQIVHWTTKSCWCYNKSNPLRIKHWLSRSNFYYKYTSLQQRCYNTSNPWYIHRWWRWIKCEWGTFEDFYNDMYESYLEHCKEFWEKQTTIDRIDSNWNYCKENCRWANYKEQSRNKNSNIVYKWLITWLLHTI